MADKVNPEIKAVQDYIDQNSRELVAKSVLAPMSTTLFTVQTGVKAETAINLLDTTVEFGDGTQCGWDPKGSDVISQRTIKPGFMKVEKPFCQKNFLNTFASYMTNVAAGRETLPFEEYFIDANIKAIGEALEKAIWYGDVDSEDENLNKFDGLFKILKAEVENGATVNVYDETAQNTMTKRVWAVYMAIADEWIDNAVIYMSKQDYRTLVKELVDANLYHYERSVDGSMEMIFPGTSTVVKGVDGMKHTANETGVIVAMDPKHTVYGVDLESTNEEFHFWFSTDNDEFRLRVNLSAGIQVALPSEVVVSADWEAGSGSGNGQ